MNRAERRRMERDMAKTKADPLVGSGFRLNVGGSPYPVRERREPFDLEAEIAISDAIHEFFIPTATASRYIEHACRLAGVDLDDAKALVIQFALECQPVVDVEAAGASMKRVIDMMEDQPTEEAAPCRQKSGNG